MIGLLLPQAHAAQGWDVLQNQAGQSVVYDEVSGAVWYRDLSALSGLTYGEQLARIQQLNAESYFNVAGWHLATPTEMGALWGQTTDTIRQTFLPSEVRFSGGYEWHYWSGRFEQGAADVHGASETGWGSFVFGPWDYSWPQTFNLVDASAYSEQAAWVVSPIPEPQAVGLVIAAIALRTVLSWRRGRSERMAGLRR